MPAGIAPSRTRPARRSGQHRPLAGAGQQVLEESRGIRIASEDGNPRLTPRSRRPIGEPRRLHLAPSADRQVDRRGCRDPPGQNQANVAAVSAEPCSVRVSVGQRPLACARFWNSARSRQQPRGCLHRPPPRLEGRALQPPRPGSRSETPRPGEQRKPSDRGSTTVIEPARSLRGGRRTRGGSTRLPDRPRPRSTGTSRTCRPLTTAKPSHGKNHAHRHSRPTNHEREAARVPGAGR